MPIVTPEELATALRWDDVERASALQAIQLAEDSVTDAIGAATAEVPWPASVKWVVLRVALRVYANPLSASQESSGVMSLTLDPVRALLSDDERAELDRLVGGSVGGSGVFTVTPY